MNFNVNGNTNQFLAAKKHRNFHTYKVRPIRMIRCDGKYSDDKLGKLPKLLRDSDKNINQE